MNALLRSLAGLALLALSTSLSAQPVHTGAFGKLAVKGYDTVAYHTEGEPTRGSKEFTAEHNGARYRFSSAENLALFQQDPERYLPQYGGHCAWAAAQKQLAPIDPKAWAIVDGKLYLNYNQDIQERWSQQKADAIKSADQYWATLDAK